MDLKKRKDYFIFTNIFWWIGFILYAGMAVAGKDLLNIPLNIFLVLLISGFGGGLLFGGLASGILLFSDFFKRQRLFIKIIFCIFSPITFMIICYVGIFSLFPYGIYNLIMLRKAERSQEIEDESAKNVNL